MKSIVLLLLTSFTLFAQVSDEVRFRGSLKTEQQGSLVSDWVMPNSYWFSFLGSPEKPWQRSYIRTLDVFSIKIPNTRESLDIVAPLVMEQGDVMRIRIVLPKDNFSQIGARDRPIPVGYFGKLISESGEVGSQTEHSSLNYFMGADTAHIGARVEIDSIAVRWYDGSNNLTSRVLTAGEGTGSIVQADTVVANSSITMPSGASFPASGVNVGDFFFKTNNDTLGIWDGSSWAKYAKDN